MYAISDRLDTWLIPSGTAWSRLLLRVNHGLTQLAPVPPLEVLTSGLSRSFCLKRSTPGATRCPGILVPGSGQCSHLLLAARSGLVQLDAAGPLCVGP